MQFSILRNAAMKMGLTAFQCGRMTLLTPLPHDTSRESWLENLTPLHFPRSRKAGFLGFLFLAVNPRVPAGLLELIQG